MSAKRRSLIQDVPDLGAKLPWYVSAILAIVVFLVLTWVSQDFFAKSPAATPSELGVSRCRACLGLGPSAYDVALHGRRAEFFVRGEHEDRVSKYRRVLRS